MNMIAPAALEIGVLVLGIFLVLYEALTKKKDSTLVGWVGITSLTLILILSFFATPDISGAAYLRFYQADFLAMFFKRFALLATIIVLAMSLEYRGTLRRFIPGADSESGLGEFFALPVFTCAGLMWMASAVDFVLIFVSLELVTISFYILVAYMRRSGASLEAGVKYFILGALSTGFLVYGITWIFGVTGETNLARIAAKLPLLSESATPLMFGMALVLIALGFKIAAVPFHFWVPDVYQGAPTPVTAYLSVGSKAAGFVVLMRVLETFMQAPFLREKLGVVIVALAAMTLIFGNLAALPQTNLKRLLAYSSIAHAGYLLVAVACVSNSNRAGEAVVFYLAAYLLMTLLSFIVLVAVTEQTQGDDIANFRGLGRRSPILAFGMLIAMASLAGVPLTAGFVGKFFVFVAAIEQRQFLLVGIGVVTVAAGFCYYLKVVRAMFWQEPVETSRLAVAPLTRAFIIALATLIIVLGVYPRPVFALLGTPRVQAMETAAR
jgi:NADH-quinone oxidoreductase subunit N